MASPPPPLKISIARETSSIEQLLIRWSSFPGKFYTLETRDGVDQQWIGTNFSRIQATSTVTRISEGILASNIPTRFFRVMERPASAGNVEPIEVATIQELEKILGLTFTERQRSDLLGVLTANRDRYEAMRQWGRLLNWEPPAFSFHSLPTGHVVSTNQEPIEWSPPARTTLPANLEELAFYTVRELGELIRTRQITSLELTRLYLERLKRYDPLLLCTITLTEELALEQAARADAEIAAGAYRGPLHGIPYGIKDLFSTRGYPTTWGAAPFSDQVIDENSTVVQKLSEAGAVLIAKLATGELAQGDIWFGGQTLNPWDLNQGSVGSSAGPASATAAGLVAFSIGTETVGSIVAPSTACRVTGLRPTYGTVSRMGAMILCWSLDTVGPICRSVEDCAIVYEAIRGPDNLDHTVVKSAFNYDPDIDLSQLRVGIHSSVTDPETRERLARIVGANRLVEFELPATPLDITLIVNAEAASAFEEFQRIGSDSLLGNREWGTIFRTGRTIPAVEYLQAQRWRYKLVQDMATLMQEVDVFVAANLDAKRTEVVDTTNLTGQPCVVIPNRDGTSLSFIARPFEEGTALALAKAYQDATTFHTEIPPGFLEATEAE